MLARLVQIDMYHCRHNNGNTRKPIFTVNQAFIKFSVNDNRGSAFPACRASKIA